MSNPPDPTPYAHLDELLATWGDNKTIPVPTDELRVALQVLTVYRPLIEWAVEQQERSRIIGAIDTDTGQFVLYRPRVKQ